MAEVMHLKNEAVDARRGWVGASVAAFALAALLALGALVCMPASALAAEVNQPDPSAGISLLVKDHHDDAFIQGTQVTIYRVAEVADNGSLTPVDTFATLPVSWDVEDGSDARALADTLAAYVARDGFAPTDSALTDANGVASFPSGAAQLEPGYYLILAGSHRAGNAWHYPMASLVALPYTHQDGSVDYAPIASMKYQEYEDVGVLDVMKVWDGENPDQPKSVTMQLLRDGQVYKTAVLNQDNGWHVQWTGLEPQYQWAVLEKSVPEDYLISIDGNSGIVAVTNTYTNEEIDQPDSPEDTPDNPGQDQPDGSDGSDEPAAANKGEGSTGSTLPQTGQLWWPVAALLMAGVVLLAAGLSKKLRK